MKTMKWLAAIALVGLAFGVSSCSHQESKPTGSSDATTHAVQYTCTMDPEIVKDKPGNCPKCGMKLVEKH